MKRLKTEYRNSPRMGNNNKHLWWNKIIVCDGNEMWVRPCYNRHITEELLTTVFGRRKDFELSNGVLQPINTVHFPRNMFHTTQTMNASSLKHFVLFCFFPTSSSSSFSINDAINHAFCFSWETLNDSAYSISTFFFIKQTQHARSILFTLPLSIEYYRESRSLSSAFPEAGKRHTNGGPCIFPHN